MATRGLSFPETHWFKGRGKEVMAGQVRPVPNLAKNLLKLLAVLHGLWDLSFPTRD